MQHITRQLKAPENECPEVRYFPYEAEGTPAGVKAPVRPTKLKTDSSTRFSDGARWMGETFGICQENTMFMAHRDHP